MRFYNSDGSVKCEDDDVDFGWSLDWVMEENETFKTEGDVDDGIVSKQSKEKLKEDDKLEKSNNAAYKVDYSQFNLEMKHKEELTDFLMRADNAESLLLVSIVNNAFYKILADSRKTTDLKNPGQTDFDLALRLNRRERLQKLRNAFGKTEKETTLLAELNQCDLVMGLEEFKTLRVWRKGNHEGSERRGAFEMIGLNGDIDKTLCDFFDKTCKVHVEVGKIGKCFREIDAKVTEIQKEALEFRKDVCETKFLDDVLHLLQGNFEKVEGPLPFRNVGKNASRTEEVNLII